MSGSKQNRGTWVFLAFLLLAGIANLLSYTDISVRGKLMTCLSDTIYTGLLLFWLQSVRDRLLPSAAKRYVVSSAFLMLLYILLRIFKYRFAMEPAVNRYAAYAYWIPQMLIPTLFLMTCIAISSEENQGRENQGRENQGGENQGGWNPDLLLLPAGFLSLMVMTNDLHFLVYIPEIDVSLFMLVTGTYRIGPAFYLLYAWMILTAAGGIILVFRKTGYIRKKAIWQLLAVLSLWAGMVFLDILVFDRQPVPISFYRVPEAHIFGMLGFIEVCIRHRLIPYNENYSAFFRRLRIPTVITDRDLNPAFHTDLELPADRAALQAAINVPVMLPSDRLLHGKEIRGGYAFWAEDESGIRRVQRRLQEANETIEQENDLLRAETEQKEMDAYLTSRHRIYHEIAAELYPCQKRITQILSEAVPGTVDFPEKIARVSVLNAYVKRKTNLLLLASESDTLGLHELALALQESSAYLTLAGLRAVSSLPDSGALSAARVIELYDVFGHLAEQLIGRAPSLMVSWRGGLRMAAETEDIPEAGSLPLPVKFHREDSILYMDIPAGEEVQGL